VAPYVGVSDPIFHRSGRGRSMEHPAPAHDDPTPAPGRRTPPGGTLRRWSLAPLLAFLQACGASPVQDGLPNAWEYRVPPVTGDGWETASLADAGLSEAPFVRLMTDLHEIGDHDVHSLVVVKGGRLVFEEYFSGAKWSLAGYTGEYGFDRDDTHNLASVTKSITTTLVGIAIDQGAIESVDQHVFDFFPEHADLLQEDPRKADLTLRHLLTMESGIRWADLETYPYSDPRNDLVQMFNSADPIGFILSRDLYAAPGADFEYCNANTNLLGEIVGRATGERLDDYSRDHLFEPLGISEYEWQMISGDVVFASGDLRLRPRDMAKVGELFLRKGVWEGTQVVSRRWVEDATARRAIPDGPHAWADGYGFGWWHWDIPVEGVTHAVYMASGWGGQWIFVIPGKDMVFVTTAGNYERDSPMDAYRMLADYLLRS